MGSSQLYADSQMMYYPTDQKEVLKMALLFGTVHFKLGCEPYMKELQKISPELSRLERDSRYYEQCKQYYDENYGIRKVKAENIQDNRTDIFDGVRYMNQNELERCQTVTQGYTKCLTRNEAADVLGDGWTIDKSLRTLVTLVVGGSSDSTYI